MSGDFAPAVPWGTGGDALKWQSITELVSSAARTWGDRPFVRDHDFRELGFADFDRRTQELADALSRDGIGPGDRVAIMMANGLTWPVAWLGVVRTGAVAVPINKRYRSDDLAFVLSNAGVRMLLGDEDVLPVVAAAACPTVERVANVHLTADGVALLTLWHTDTPAPPAPPLVGVANLQYTSGTTGFPKGCMLSEDYWLRAGWLTAEAGELRASDVVLTSQPYSYIDPQWQTIMCLMSGATLVVLPGFSARGFFDAIRSHRATWIYVLGTMPQILSQQPPSPLDTQHALRLVLCSGIAPNMHAAFEARWGAPWREAYGMTETAIDLVVPVAATHTVGSGVAGRPVATKEIMIAAPDGAPVAVGKVGELWLRGQPMMSGYFGRKEEAAHALEGGWLRTGDLATVDEQGWVSIVGRLKDMVRRAGENISAAEVEAVVAGHPEVLMSAIVPVPDTVLEEEVKIFVRLRQPPDDATQAARSIVAYASDRLAPFKVPRYVEFVDDFERTASERVVKAALARPDQRQGSFDAVADRWLR